MSRRRVRRTARGCPATLSAEPQHDDADDQALADLLRAVREVRTTLAIDLAAAAGALEAGRPEIARDIVSATSDEVASIGAGAGATRVRPATPRRSNARRALLALPVVPLLGAIAMTAAAAIGGSGSSTPHARHESVSASAPHQRVVAAHLPSTTAAHDAATTTLHRLEHVVTHDPRAAQVLAVAADLHQQLTAMIATATDDPARLHVVRQLLTLEQHVLETSKVPGTQLALAASQEIARLLELAPTTKHDVHSLSTQTTPSTAATAHPTAAAHASPVVPHQQPTSTVSATTGHTPTSTPSNTLFGRGVFGRR